MNWIMLFLFNKKETLKTFAEYQWVMRLSWTLRNCLENLKGQEVKNNSGKFILYQREFYKLDCRHFLIKLSSIYFCNKS